MKKKQLSIEALIRIIAILIYILSAQLLYKSQGFFGESYVFSFMALLAGFSLITLKTLLGQFKSLEVKGYSKLLIAFIISYPVTLFISFNVLFPIVNKLSVALFECPYNLLFTMAIFFCLGWGIDPIDNEGRIFDGLLKYYGKIKYCIKKERK